MKTGNKSKGKKTKLVKSNFDIKSLKCDYFWGIIFSYLSKKKSLKMVKFSKNMQKLINVSINDYKEYYLYTQLSSPIEIEIIPDKKISGYFINIPDKDKKYYHIYYDN